MLSNFSTRCREVIKLNKGKTVCLSSRSNQNQYGCSFSMEEEMYTGEKIKYFREVQGMTQETLSERTGINVSTIRKYELGHRHPKREQLKILAKGLDVSEFEFLDIKIRNENDLIAMLKKISPFFKWERVESIFGWGEKK